jgi:hypothetical protein
LKGSLQELYPGIAWKSKVRQNDIDCAVVDKAASCFGRSSRQDLEFRFEQPLEHVANSGIVVNDEDGALVTIHTVGPYDEGFAGAFGRPTRVEYKESPSKTTNEKPSQSIGVDQILISPEFSSLFVIDS